VSRNDFSALLRRLARRVPRDRWADTPAAAAQ
jgi:hypothetical protein